MPRRLLPNCKFDIILGIPFDLVVLLLYVDRSTLARVTMAFEIADFRPTL